MDFLGFMVVSVHNMVQSLLSKINLEEITMSHLNFSTKKKKDNKKTYLFFTRLPATIELLWTPWNLWSFTPLM